MLGNESGLCGFTGTPGRRGLSRDRRAVYALDSTGCAICAGFQGCCMYTRLRNALISRSVLASAPGLLLFIRRFLQDIDSWAMRQRPFSAAKISGETMTPRYSTVFTALSAVLLSACATPTVVQTVKPGDYGLTCAQLQNEYADAERFRAEADAEKSVTGGNVVRALFFWPAILGTAANANEAIAAADTRKVSLANIMNQKNCAIPASPVVSNQNISLAQGDNPNQQSTEAQLIELKRLFDANLITKDVYAERQKALLEGRTK